MQQICWRLTASPRHQQTSADISSLESFWLKYESWNREMAFYVFQSEPKKPHCFYITAFFYDSLMTFQQQSDQLVHREPHNWTLKHHHFIFFIFFSINLFTKTFSIFILNKKIITRCFNKLNFSVLFVLDKKTQFRLSVESGRKNFDVKLINHVWRIKRDLRGVVSGAWIIKDCEHCGDDKLYLIEDNLWI